MLQRSVFLHYSFVDKLQILFLDYDLNYGFYKTNIGKYGIICNWGYTIRKKGCPNAGIIPYFCN